MARGNFSMILLNIALILFGINYSEIVGPNNNSLVTGINNDNTWEENAQVYNLKGARGGNGMHDNALQERPLKVLNGKLFVQRRKLLNIKKKIDEIFNALSRRLEKFCEVPEKTYALEKPYSYYNFKDIDYGDNDLYDMSYENNIEFNNLMRYSEEIKKYLESRKHTKDVYTSSFLPVIQKNVALQRYIKNVIDECSNLIEFIHKKKGKIQNIDAYLEKSGRTYPMSLYSYNNESNGIFSSTTAKITLGILGCLLVSGGIAFAFYYKKIMLKN